MAIPVIMQGDASGGITVTLAGGHDYAGATLVVVFNGVTRQFANLVAGGTVVLAYTADETANMPLGTGRVLMRLIGANGNVETVGNADARIKVTDCVAEVNAGGLFAVTPGSSPLSDVEGLGTRYTGDQLRAKINEVIAKLGGTVAALALALLPCLGGVSVQTAPLGGIYNDSPVVTNVTVDVSDKADKANTYTKAETDARIVELLPPTDLTPATNYTDGIIGAFAATGAVARAASYGTPTRWTDATGCVWEIWADAWIDHNTGNIFRNGTSIFPSDFVDGEMSGYLTYDPNAMVYLGLEGEGWYYNGQSTSGTPGGVFPGGPDATSLDNGRFTLGFTNLVGRVALTNDLPSTNGFLRAESDPHVPSWAKASSKPSYSWSEITGKPSIPATAADVGATTSNDVESIIRERSLNGIWDSKLGVWWTPIMENGAYRLTATTNVNMNLEGN